MSFSSTDYITVLTVRYPYDAVMTKRLRKATNGVIYKTDYDDALKFDVQKIGINHIADLCDVLFDLSEQPNKVAIRGMPIDRHYDVYRRLHGDKAAFVAHRTGHHWFCADFDEVPLPIFLDPGDDVEIILGYLVRLLPPVFWNVSFYWQWSCGHGLDGGKTLRAHLWFWSREKHTDREYENWAKWINGEAGWKILDPAVFRTVQPNYTAGPILEDGVNDPVTCGRNGVHIGDLIDVLITIPSKDWDHHVRQQEREEYDELVDYGLRRPCEAFPLVNSSDRYLDYLARIGDDLDGFYEPMTKAIWHWAKAYPEDLDADFKHALRCVVRSASCTKQRDLDEYLSDHRLDASLRGAREKLTERRLETALERYRGRQRFSLSHSRKE
jgi:hypothetical protein